MGLGPLSYCTSTSAASSCGCVDGMPTCTVSAGLCAAPVPPLHFFTGSGCIPTPYQPCTFLSKVTCTAMRSRSPPTVNATHSPSQSAQQAGWTHHGTLPSSPLGSASAMPQPVEMVGVGSGMGLEKEEVCAAARAKQHQLRFALRGAPSPRVKAAVIYSQQLSQQSKMLALAMLEAATLAAAC